MSTLETIKEKVCTVKVAKSCTYRVISFIITFSITLYMTNGNIAIALSVGPLDQFFKFFVYFAHEAQWEKYLKRREAAKVAKIEAEVYGTANDDEDDDE